MSRNAGRPRDEKRITCAADLAKDVMQPGRKVHIDHMNWRSPYQPYCLDHCGALLRLTDSLSTS